MWPQIAKALVLLLGMLPKDALAKWLTKALTELEEKIVESKPKWDNTMIPLIRWIKAQLCGAPAPELTMDSIVEE
jgi:hypothetical protein